MDIKSEIMAIISRDKLDVSDAKRLYYSNWRDFKLLYPRPIQQEIDSFYYSLEGYVEQVDEGYVDGEKNDTILLEEAKTLVKKL